MCAEKVKYFGELELQGDNRMDNVWFQSPDTASDPAGLWHEESQFTPGLHNK